MKIMAVTYKIKSDLVNENERLISNVFADLHQRKPSGLRYASFKLDDGVSFMHLVATDEAAVENPLVGLPAFKSFVEGISARCEEQPKTTELTLVGSYDLLDPL